MIPKDAEGIASHCRHYAMCKIDYLGTGICESGCAMHYVSYYPQGRMDLYDALVKKLIPVTDALVDIADSCDLCGVCDAQCHFVTGMRPTTVMRALKERVEAHRRGGGAIEHPAADSLVDALRAIVGAEWASNDPAIRLTYSNDPFPLAGMRMPRAVALPGSRDQVVEIVRLANRSGVPYVARGNGGSVFGFVFTDGIVLDMARMQGLEIDAGNWVAAVEPGVTAFDLQRAAASLHRRVNVAEPSAMVCANIICTGMFSTWANVYGVSADHYVDLEIVDRDGRVFRLNDKDAPNVFAFRSEGSPSPGIVTKAWMRMHPTTDDEEGVLVPFHSFDEALAFARELSIRRIGLAIGVLGGHYLATFLSPSAELAEKARSAFSDTLGIEYAVSVVGDRYAREAIRKMARTVIDQELFRTLLFGLPRLADPELIDLVGRLETEAYPYETLLGDNVRPLLEAALSPSPKQLAESTDPEMRAFYAGLYERPEISDLVWLTTYRILSCRLARHKHVFVLLAYVPFDTADVAKDLVARFAEIADRHGIGHEYGFVTPIDLGKRAILEYDYYVDQADPAETPRVAGAMAEIGPMLDDLRARTKGVISFKYVFSQGASRKENIFYT